MTLSIRLALIVVGTAVYLALAVLGWGGFAAFLHPALIAIAVAVFVMAGASVFAGGNLSWCARGSWQPLGHRSLFAARTAGRISAGLRGPEGVLDLPLLARIRAEERMLRTQFGDQYDTYCARTSRLVPGLF